ncbi:MAG TPA: hypothetical protein VJ376_00890 [Pseudomonadota bacterium]|nr:hypothetical protein [Pseudomonadota bacterium]
MADASAILHRLNVTQLCWCFIQVGAKESSSRLLCTIIVLTNHPGVPGPRIRAHQVAEIHSAIEKESPVA